jgi:hypothetical protein
VLYSRIWGVYIRTRTGHVARAKATVWVITVCRRTFTSWRQLLSNGQQQGLVESCGRVIHAFDSDLLLLLGISVLVVYFWNTHEGYRGQ